MNLTEHDIIQNIGIGAFSLWQFTSSYQNATNFEKGPRLPIVMPVLPILFHKDSVEAIYNRHFEGGLFNALSEHRDLPAGLQQRMQAMSSQTFESLNLAFSTKLLSYDRELNQIVTAKKTKPFMMFNEEIKKMIQGANRLGYWFSSLSFEQICLYLNIRF